MKNILLPFLLLLAGEAAMGQNLVQNPTFANYDICPDAHSQIERCQHWRAPTVFVSTDYFHECNNTLPGTTGLYGVPSNIGSGYQPSSSGSYIGLFTFVSTDTKEYAATDLPPLLPGESYRVVMVVSLFNGSMYGVDGLGAYFYNLKKPDTNSYTLITHTPQIDYSWYGAITDTQNWVTLVDTFVADSAYEHMVIGCFKADAAQTKTIVDASKPAHSYYFIDSMAVERILPPSTIVNKNQKMSLEARIYPQPFTDRAIVDIAQVTGAGTYELNLYNIQGKLVRRIDGLGAGQTAIYRAGLASGIYFYEVHSHGAAVYRGKVIVE